MKSKLKFIVPIALIAVLGGGYKFGFAKDAPKAPKPKVHGEVYVLSKDFLINLEGGRYAKLGVALLIEHGTAVASAEDGGHAAPAEPPEGYGTLPQEALVRDIITDVLTDSDADELTSKDGRHKVKEQVLKTIKKSTDVHIEDVLFTDVAVQ
jgi:flagellar basal body-associated protein FliL